EPGTDALGTGSVPFHRLSRKEGQMLQKLLGVVAVLGLIGSSPALAQEQQTETHQGKVVSVKGDELIMTGPDGKEMTHTLAPDAKVMCDGKPCHLSDLKAGMTVKLTTKPDNPKMALSVTAFSGAREQRTGARPFLGLRTEQTVEGVTVRAV